MPIEQLTERDHLTIELALVIEDPAGIEALDLAAVILETFAKRSPRQCEVMRQSLWRWSQQFPRSLAAVDAASAPPPTQRNICNACGGARMVGKALEPGGPVTQVPCPLCNRL